MAYSPTKEQQRALNKAKNALVLDLPFYSVVALSLELNYSPEVSTADVDGVRIRVNPEWFVAMSSKQRIGLLCHEVEHVVRLHNWRMKSRNHSVWNSACDAVINCSVRKQGLDLPDGGVEYPWADGLSEEAVYKRLMQEQDEQPQDGPGDGERGDGGQPGQGSPGDRPFTGDLVPGEMSGESETRAKELGKSAATMAKAMGKLPAGMQELIDQINEPSVSWRDHMAAWMSELAQLDSSWSRPNRTWLTRGVRLPGMQSEDSLGELGVVLDQSGSMSTPEVRQSFAEVCGMVASTNPRKVIVVYLDSAVAHVDVFDNPSAAELRTSAKRRACGGTDMRIGLDYLEKEYPSLAGAVVLTDGDTPFGNPKSFPVMWAITQQGKSAPWGTTVPVEVS